MSVFVISDLHLTHSASKKMDVFGGEWVDYMVKIRDNWKKTVSEEDTVFLPGDFSWAMDLNEALEDFRYLDSLPGKKVLLKGNHDYFWNSLNKMSSFLTENGIRTVSFLQNTSVFCEGNYYCGTRGWFVEDGSLDEKIYQRELQRLKLSLSSVPEDQSPICFLHYPPKYLSVDYPEMRRCMEDYGVRYCYYGHMHGKSLSAVFEGNLDGIEYRCVSADHLKFCPLKIKG